VSGTPHSSPADTTGAARNTAYALATQLTTAAFTAVLTLYLVRALGPADFGLFSLALGIAALVFLPSDFGISQSAARFIAERRDDRGAVAELFADALRIKLLAGAVVSVVLFAVAEPIASAYDEPDLAWPLRLIAGSLFAESVFAFYRYSHIAMNRLRTTLGLVSAESVAECGLSIALVALGAGAAGAAGGRAGGYAFGAVVAAAVTLRLLGRRSHAVGRRPTRGATRMIAGYAGALLIIDSVYAAIAQAGVLLVGALLGAAAAGFFSGPTRLIVFLGYLGLAASNAVAPRLARSRDRPPDVATFTAAIRYVLLFQALLVAPVAVWAEPIVDLLLGPDYEESVEVLRALTPYVFLFGLAPLLSVSVNYLGEARRRIPITLGTLAISAGLGYVLIESEGVVGAAIATDVAFLLYVPAHLWVCTRLLDMRLRPVGLALLRGLLAAAAMAGVLLAFGTSDLSPLEAVAGGVLGLTAFAAVLLVTREVSLDELRGLPRALRTRAGGAAPRTREG
jgi:O-antigen/teichoic acid export membrane protein